MASNDGTDGEVSCPYAAARVKQVARAAKLILSDLINSRYNLGMETSLHRQLKYHFAADSDSVEIMVDGFRIDAIDANGSLVEIQHAGLGSIRNKAKKLLESGHRLRIIKPLISCKWIETFDRDGGELIRRRKSPKKLVAIDIFRELIHFTQVFPSPKLTLEILSVECIEQRIDRVNKRHRRKQYKTLDQHLSKVGESNVMKGIPDLWRLLGNPKLPKAFDTKELAEYLGQPRWFAQQIAYTLHRCGATEIFGKRGNSIAYSRKVKTPSNSDRKKVA